MHAMAVPANSAEVMGNDVKCVAHMGMWTNRHASPIRAEHLPTDLGTVGLLSIAG
jgi:hypothetical protein